jgi:O-antigen ligase
VLGAWLFISTFIWPHGSSAATNSWIVGLAIVVVSIIAMYVPWFRWLNTALAVWLFVSTLVVIRATTETMWNNTIVAILVFLISLIPGGLHPTTGQPRRIAQI